MTSLYDIKRGFYTFVIRAFGLNFFGKSKWRAGSKPLVGGRGIISELGPLIVSLDQPARPGAFEMAAYRRHTRPEIESHA